MTPMLTLAQAFERKWGYSRMARDPKGHMVYSGHLRSVANSPLYQPWAGYALRDGASRFWPTEDVERWAGVWNHNRHDYYRELLADPREHVREGVRAQLEKILGQGRLPKRIEFVLMEQVVEAAS